MKDTELCTQILGLQSPWKVVRVDLDRSSSNVVVHVSVAVGRAFARPSCGRHQLRQAKSALATPGHLPLHVDPAGTGGAGDVPGAWRSDGARAVGRAGLVVHQLFEAAGHRHRSGSTGEPPERRSGHHHGARQPAEQRQPGRAGNDPAQSIHPAHLDGAVGYARRIIVNRDLVLRPYRPLYFNRGTSRLARVSCGWAIAQDDLACPTSLKADLDYCAAQAYGEAVAAKNAGSAHAGGVHGKGTGIRSLLCEAARSSPT